MTDPIEELSTLLDEQKTLLVSVATYGPRVQERLTEYTDRRTRIRDLLNQVGLQDPIPFATLWEWYWRWNDGSLPTFEARRACVEQMIQPVIDRLGSQATLTPDQREASTGWNGALLDIFVSHSAKDRELAGQLAGLLRSALNLPPERIRCTSVDGYRLEVGANAAERLREEAREACVLVALLTPNSLNSPFVFFELGARWGAGLYLAPVVAGGISPSDLKAPLSGINVLQLASRAQVFQFVQEVARELEREVVSVAAIDDDIGTLVRTAAQA